MHKICVHNKCMTEASFVIIIQQQHTKKRVPKQVPLNFNRLNTFPLLCLTFEITNIVSTFYLPGAI